MFKRAKYAVENLNVWEFVLRRANVVSVVLLAVLLGGCTSFLRGAQYKFPEPGEPSAIVRTPYINHTALHVINFADSGCYSGWTPLNYKDGFIESPVAVGKSLVLTYIHESVGEVCQVHFSLTPQAGVAYTILSSSWSDPVKGIIPLLDTERRYCGIGAVKQIGEQQSVEPIKKLRIDMGLRCLKFVE